MKFSSLSKLVGVGILAASAAFVPFTPSASAQVDAAPRTEVGDADYDNDFDWGWLGLLGLAGLAGLAGRKRHDRDDVRYRTDDQVSTTNYR